MMPELEDIGDCALHLAQVLCKAVCTYFDVKGICVHLVCSKVSTVAAERPGTRSQRSMSRRSVGDFNDCTEIAVGTCS